MDTRDLFDREQIVRIAKSLLDSRPVHITDDYCEHSPGGRQDYYSNGDYWWPDPEAADGLPYICRDGESNPDNFMAHRKTLRRMRFVVTHLTAAYKITGDEHYANRAVTWLKEFFVDSETRMQPHLTYAQAIPGVCEGRGIGIIDTVHLLDVPVAAAILKEFMQPETWAGLQDWFGEYLKWMNTHPNGIAERDWHNNHAVTWFAQASSFARFVGDEEMLAFCRERFKKVLLPEQMAADGSFPLELARTKPYNYSCFILDNLTAICLFASDENDCLWEFTSADGCCLQRGLSFLLPYLQDKSKWPYGKEQEYDEVWPVAMPFMLFAGIYYNDNDYLSLWQQLEQYPASEEIRRNISIRCPCLLLEKLEGDDKSDELLCI